MLERALGLAADTAAIVALIAADPAFKTTTEKIKGQIDQVQATVDMIRQRADQERTAKGANTTPQKIDELFRRYEVMGLSTEEAGKHLEQFSRWVDSSVDKTRKGPDFLEKWGIKSVDRYGNRLDKADMYKLVMAKVADQYKRNAELHAKIEADRAAGKINPRDLKEVSEGEMKVSSIAGLMGYDNKTVGAFKEIGGSANLNRKAEDSIAVRPLTSPEAQAKFKAAADKLKAAELLLARYNDALQETLLDRVDELYAEAKELAERDVEDGVKNGEFKETMKEKADGEARVLGALMPDQKEAASIIDGAGKGELKGEEFYAYRRMQAAAAKAAIANDYKKDRLRNAPKPFKAHREIDENAANEGLHAAIAFWKDLQAKIQPNGLGITQKQNAFGSLLPLNDRNWRDILGQGARSFGISGAPNSNGSIINNYYIGVRTGPGAGSIANGVVGAIQNAPGLRKTTQGSTAGGTDP